MDEKAKRTFRQIIGIESASKPVQTVSTVIGGLLGLGGFIGALNEKNQEKTFLQATKDTQLRLGQVGADFGVRAEETKAALGADLSAHQTRIEAQAAQGLESRGLGSFAPASAKQLKAGSSGAYAMARSALEAAKLNAGRAVSGALSTYKQGIAQKQYESMLSQYYGRLGLWQALGGMGSALLNAEIPESQKTESADVEDYVPTIQEITTPFRMKGIKDSTPEYAPGKGLPLYRKAAK